MFCRFTGDAGDSTVKNVKKFIEYEAHKHPAVSIIIISAKYYMRFAAPHLIHLAFIFLLYTLKIRLLLENKEDFEYFITWEIARFLGDFAHIVPRGNMILLA